MRWRPVKRCRPKLRRGTKSADLPGDGRFPSASASTIVAGKPEAPSHKISREDTLAHSEGEDRIRKTIFRLAAPATDRGRPSF